MRQAALAVLVTALLALTGCGDDREATAQESLADSMAKKQGSGDLVALEREEADCVAEGMVDGIGVDKLQEYGFLNEDLEAQGQLQDVKMSRADAEELVDSMFSCTDVMASVRKAFTEDMTDADAKTKACVEDALGEQQVRGLLVDVFSGKDPQQAAGPLVAPLMRCAMGSMDAPSQ